MQGNYIARYKHGICGKLHPRHSDDRHVGSVAAGRGPRRSLFIIYLYIYLYTNIHIYIYIYIYILLTKETLKGKLQKHHHSIITEFILKHE